MLGRGHKDGLCCCPPWETSAQRDQRKGKGAVPVSLGSPASQWPEKRLLPSVLNTGQWVNRLCVNSSRKAGKFNLNLSSEVLLQ